jgi:hypothetical protein
MVRNWSRGDAAIVRGVRLKPTRDDARYQGKVSVWYPYHPLYGFHNLSILRESGYRDVHYVELAARERLVVPSWVLDQERCEQMTFGLQPAVDLATLVELADWLREQSL